MIASENDIIQISEELSTEIKTFYLLFNDFRAEIFSIQSQALQENSAFRQKVSNEGKQLLIELKECQKRVSANILCLESLLSSKTVFQNQNHFVVYSNLKDFLQTCETVFNHYDSFFRKDIKLLVETFEKLSSDVKKI